MVSPCLAQILKRDRWATVAETSASLSAVTGVWTQLSLDFETFINISKQNLNEPAENLTGQEQDMPAYNMSLDRPHPDS